MCYLYLEDALYAFSSNPKSHNGCLAAVFVFFIINTTMKGESTSIFPHLVVYHLLPCCLLVNCYGLNCITSFIKYEKIFCICCFHLQTTLQMYTQHNSCSCLHTLYMAIHMRTGPFGKKLTFSVFVIFLNCQHMVISK